MNDYSRVVKKNLNTTQHQTLKEAVYVALRTTIIMGDISAGTRINELELSTSLNISRTPIRYALTKLADEQLVEHEHEVGMIVKGISIKDAHEIFKIRVALETLATTEAMQKMDEDDFDKLEDLLILCSKLNATNRVDEVMENFSSFNTFIFEMADMPRLHSIIIELKTYLEYFRDISIRSYERRNLALEEHWIIYRGMKNHDQVQIQMIIKEHLGHSLDFIITEMERHNIE